MAEPTASSEPAAALPEVVKQMLREEIRREWRGGRIRFGIAAGLALVLATGIPFAKTMAAGSGLELAAGQLVDVRRYANERREVGVYAFTDRLGRHREATSSMEPGARLVGEKVEILHSMEDLAFSRPLNDSERYLHVFFIGITAFQATFAAGVFAWVWRLRRSRERLLRHGVAVTGSSPRIEQRQLPIPNLPRQWRLCVLHFDPRRSRWREHRSAWRDAPAPVLAHDRAVPPTLFDAAGPPRYWQPLGWLDPQRPPSR